MSKKAFFVLALLMPAGCSSADRNDVRTEPESDPSLTVIRHETSGVAAHVSTDRTGTPILQASADAAKTTREFLAQHKDLFGMHDPLSELVVKRSRGDALGMKHVRFQQVVHGIPVTGAEITA